MDSLRSRPSVAGPRTKTPCSSAEARCAPNTTLAASIYRTARRQRYCPKRGPDQIFQSQKNACGAQSAPSARGMGYAPNFIGNHIGKLRLKWHDVCTFSWLIQTASAALSNGGPPT